MGIKLIVIDQFQDYIKGDEITDAALVAEILASENFSHVVKVATPDAPPPVSSFRSSVAATAQ